MAGYPIMDCYPSAGAGMKSGQWILFYNLGLEEVHGNTKHVHGFPRYEFMNLDMNRISICLDMSYITNYDIFKAIIHGTYIIDHIMSKAFEQGPSVCYDAMFGASGHELYIYDRVVVGCLDTDIWF